LYISDIEGSSPIRLVKERKRSTGFNNIDYDDVTKGKWITSRCENPLAPEYSLRDEHGKLYKLGKIPGSYPKEGPAPINEKTRNQIMTLDILGA
jgi:hypothetical protein